MLEQTPREQRQQLIDNDHIELSLRRQCELLKVNRSTLYYKAAVIEAAEIDLLNEIREIWERYPFYGYRRITRELKFKGHKINRKRVQRLMQLGGIQYTLARTQVGGIYCMQCILIYCGIWRLFAPIKRG